MKKYLAIILAIILPIMLLSGCSEEEEELDTRYPLFIGEQEFLESPKKVVALSSTIVEQMVILGYGARLSVVPDDVSDIAGIEDLPSFGNINSPDLEVILDSSPDLVITTTDIPDYLKKGLETALIPVLKLNRSDSLEETYQDFAVLCTLFEGAEKGELKAAKVQYMGDALLAYSVEGVANAFASEKLTSPPTAMWMAASPMIIATGDTLEGKLLNEMGFYNVAQSCENWIISPELIEEMTIDYLFYSDDLDLEILAEKEPLKSSNAVANQMTVAFDISPFERRSPRMFFEIYDIAEELFPDVIIEMPNIAMPMPEVIVVELTWWEEMVEKVSGIFS